MDPHHETAAAVPRRSPLAGVLGGRLTIGALWNITGAVFNQGSTFVLGIIVAKVLGRELYGAFGFLQGTLLMFTNLAQLALGFAATKYIAEYRAADKPRAGRVIALCGGLSVLTGALYASVALITARPIAANLAHQPAVESVIRFAAPAILFVAVGATLTGALSGMQRFRSIAVVGLISGVAYVTICSVGAIQWNLRGVAIGLSVSALLQCLVVLLFVRSAAAKEGIEIPPPSREVFVRERDVFTKTALPAGLSGFTTLPALWIISAILVRQPNGLSQLALFSAANSLRLLVNFLPALINNVGFSVLSSHKGSADHDAYRSVFRTNLMMVTGIALAGAAAIAVAGKPALRLYGNAFADAYPVLLILLIASLAEAASIAAYQIIQTHGNMWLSVFGISLPRDAVIVVLAFVLAPRLGAAALGVALAGGALTTLACVLIIAARTRHSIGGEAARA